MSTIKTRTKTKACRVSTVLYIAGFCGVATIMHIICKFIVITLHYFHSDTMVMVDDVQESDSTTVSGINVCGESMLATVCAEVASTGAESAIISL